MVLLWLKRMNRPFLNVELRHTPNIVVFCVSKISFGGTFQDIFGYNQGEFPGVREGVVRTILSILYFAQVNRGNIVCELVYLFFLILLMLQVLLFLLFIAYDLKELGFLGGALNGVSLGFSYSSGRLLMLLLFLFLLLVTLGADLLWNCVYCLTALNIVLNIRLLELEGVQVRLRVNSEVSRLELRSYVGWSR
jgi:hypothetical protein